VLESPIVTMRVTLACLGGISSPLKPSLLDLMRKVISFSTSMRFQGFTTRVSMFAFRRYWIQRASSKGYMAARFSAVKRFLSPVNASA